MSETALASSMLIVAENFGMIKDVMASAAMYLGVPLSTLWIWQEFKDYVHLLSYLFRLRSNRNVEYVDHTDKVFTPLIFNTYPKYDIFE